jgi:hypothetical protein
MAARDRSPHLLGVLEPTAKRRDLQLEALLRTSASVLHDSTLWTV